jgi:hypothetical protein
LNEIPNLITEDSLAELSEEEQSDYTGSIDISDVDEQVPRIKKTQSKDALALKKQQTRKYNDLVKQTRDLVYNL